MKLFGKKQAASETAEAEAEAEEELRRAIEALGRPAQVPPAWEAPAPAPAPGAGVPEQAEPGDAPVRRRVRKSPPAGTAARRQAG